MLPAPASLRETILLFGHLRPALGVGNLFARVDWSGVSRRQLVHAFLDRPPATAAETLEPPGWDPAGAAMHLFTAPEFRADLARRLLQTFSDKQRLLFVHVPKAAGTDFTATMRNTLPYVGSEMNDPAHVPEDALAKRLRRLARALDRSDTIFMGGHIGLSWFLDQRLYRLQDRLVAILRHPRDICLSMANYVVHQFAEDAGLTRPDTRSWASVLGLGAGQIAALDPTRLALMVATHPGLQPVNPICSLLGDGTAAGTFATLMRAPIEITTTAQYSAWLHASWGLQRETRVNASRQVIVWDDLSPWQQSRIEAGCQQDYPVYEVVLAGLERNGTLSITGPDVARFAGQMAGR
jgi:hypothetical protein